MKYLFGNWKCYKGLAEANSWFDVFQKNYLPNPDLQVSIAPHFLLLPALAEKLSTGGLQGFHLTAQDASPFPRGSYTGAIAADMLKGLTEYVIVGHSERRRYFHEKPQEVVNKFIEVVDAGLIPVVCLENSDSSLLLETIKDTENKGLILAYTPVDSVSFNISESPERVSDQINRIAERVPGYPIIYGGGINEKNGSKYMSIPGVSGLFVGNASLDAKSFLLLCRMMAA